MISFHAKPLKPPILGKSMVERVHKLAIFGMTCGGCSISAKLVLESIHDVLDAVVSHENDSGVITTTENLTTDNVIVMVKSAGFNASA